MAPPLTLLTLPPEIRSVIWQYLFDTPRLVAIRCPRRCRLRQSRVDKDDPSGILYACRLLREEAVPSFFAVNTLKFRHTSEVLEFLGDPDLDPHIKHNIMRIAVDDGDVMDHRALVVSQVTAIWKTFTMMPGLRALEFRVWARSDNAHYLTNLEKLCGHWKSLKNHRDAIFNHDFSNTQDYSDLALTDPQQVLAMTAMETASVHVGIHESKQKYTTAGLSRLTQPDNVHLHVCNLLLSKDANEKRNLDCAKNAVVQRMKVAGANHINDDNVLERLTWAADDFPSLMNPRAVGERYR